MHGAMHAYIHTSSAAMVDIVHAYALQANATPAAKVSYKAADRANKHSASADFERHWTAQLSSVQHNMRKSDIHSAYKCLNPNEQTHSQRWQNPG